MDTPTYWRENDHVLVTSLDDAKGRILEARDSDYIRVWLFDMRRTQVFQQKELVSDPAHKSLI